MEKVWYRIKGHEIGHVEKEQILRLFPEPASSDAMRNEGSDPAENSAAWDIAVTVATEPTSAAWLPARYSPCWYDPEPCEPQKKPPREIGSY